MAAMIHFSYTVTGMGLRPVPVEGSPSDPIQVIALKMYLCPSKVALHSPEGKSQTFTVLSHDPDTRVSLSPGLNAMEDTVLPPCQMSVTPQRSTAYALCPVRGEGSLY